MAMTLKLSVAKAHNPTTNELGFRTTVKSNGKADMDTLVASASKNTTLHRAELRMAFELMLDAMHEALSNGYTVELKGIGNIGFTCSGQMTKNPDDQHNVEHKIGVAFYPSHEVRAAIALAKTSWTKDEDTEEGGDDSKPGSGEENEPGSGDEMGQ